MTTKNYIDVTGKFQFFSKSYAYVDFYNNDSKTYLADEIFIRHGLRVKFAKNELVNEDNKYRIILCDIKKKDNDKFLECMKQLENKMLLYGYTDYIDDCKEIWSVVESLVTK